MDGIARESSMFAVYREARRPSVKQARRMDPDEARRFLAFLHRNDFWLLKPIVRCVTLALMEMKRGRG